MPKISLAVVVTMVNFLMTLLQVCSNDLTGKPKF